MMNPVDGYATLAVLLERELELVRSGRFDELADLHDAQDHLRSDLTAVAPATARAALERCRELQRNIEQELLAARETILDELRAVRHSQRAAQGYMPMRTPVARVTARA